MKMIAGNPDKFAFLIERVGEWESNGFINGLMYIYMNGKLYPCKLRTTTLNSDLPSLFDDRSSAFVRPKVSRKLYAMNGKKLFKRIRRLRFPFRYSDKPDTDEDYRFDVTLNEMENAGYHLFVVTDGNDVRLLLGGWKYKKKDGKFKYLDDVELSAVEYQSIIRRVYFYYRNGMMPVSAQKMPGTVPESAPSEQ